MRGLIALALLCACGTAPTRMGVTAAPAACLASLSTTLGIGLTPESTPPEGVKVRYRWHADRGSLKSYTEDTQETVVLGADALNDGGKLYWSCDGEGIGDRSPVTVSVITENAKTGAALARTDVRLEWDDEKMRVSR